MTIIISSAANASPRIGYHNLLDEASTVTASSSDTGFDVENAYDWLLHDWWKPASTGTSYITATFASAVSADYFAVFGHNLHTYGASVKLQYSTDSGSTWNDATTAQAPATGKVIFVGFDSVLASQWRVVLASASGPASLGMVAFGEALVFPYGMPDGFAPPLLGEDEYLNSQAEGGAFLGRSLIRRGESVEIRQRNVTPEWVRNYWQPFIAHAKQKPFFFSWDYENHPDEAAFCWTDKTPAKPAYSGFLYMNVSLSVQALTEL